MVVVLTNDEVMVKGLGLGFRVVERFPIKVMDQTVSVHTIFIIFNGLSNKLQKE